MKEKINFFQKQLEYYEENRFGAMTLMLTFQSCLGSVAAMLSLHHNNVIALAICAVITMASNAAFISQAPSKWCLNIFYLSVIANTIIIIYGLLQ